MDVGPGAYRVSKYNEKLNIMNPTIPRQPKPKTFASGRQAKRYRNRGSIRADYETDSDEEIRYSPGPGNYI